ncbi:4791_t:CDS:10 [Entrophospora sp. SA101]|nr:4791_t:CDS:10 [Entrophospora sp. SA101]
MAAEASTPSTPITAIHNKRPFIQQNNKSFTELLQEIFSTLQYNQLKLLCSETPISPYDLSVWESILMNEKFFTTNTGQDAYDVEIATVSLAIELGHILSSEFTGDIPFEAYNSLFLVRIFTKHFAGNMTCNEIHKQFEESQLDNNSNEKPDFSKYQKLVIDPEIMKDSRLKAEQLIDALLKVITNLDPIRSSAALPTDPSPIAERSLLILLLLASQSRILKDGSINKFREAIKSLKDVQGSENTNTMNISQLPSEEVCLILYLFMIENVEFRIYVLSQLDPETLLLQILRLLYDGIEGQTNYSQMYILLTILLLLSQDEIFNENIQKIIVIYQPWFTERLMKSISLAGLTYLVLIRIIQFNLGSHRVINYFQTRISEVNLRSPSAEEISEVIVTSARTWSASRLKEFPELKFKYGEELESQEFFCPYVWSLVYQHTWIYWDEDKVHIINNYFMVSNSNSNDEYFETM